MSGLLRNISWLGAANLAVKPIWFLFVTALCMRVLGVDGYGRMTAALALAGVAANLIDLGMARYTVREVARDRSLAGRFFTNFLSFRGAMSLVALGAVLLTGWILGYRDTALLAVLFAAAYTYTLELTNYCRSFYEATEDLRRQAVMLVVEKTLVVAAGAALLLLTRSPEWTLAGMAIGMTITTGLNARWISTRIAPFRPADLDWGFLRRAIRIMVPLGLAGAFFNLYFRVGLVMVEAYLGETAAGQYGAAFRILEALNVLPSVIVISAIYPRLSRLLHEGETGDFRRLFLRSQWSLAAVSVGIALGLTLFSSAVISLLDPDPAFSPAGPALRVLSWAFPIYCANSLLYSALVAAEDDRFTAWSLAAAVVVNIGLNAVLIPAWGIQGAAFSAIAPEVVLAVVYGMRYRRIMARLSAS